MYEKILKYLKESYLLKTKLNIEGKGYNFPLKSTYCAMMIMLQHYLSIIQLFFLATELKYLIIQEKFFSSITNKRRKIVCICSKV